MGGFVLWREGFSYDKEREVEGVLWWFGYGRSSGGSGFGSSDREYDNGVGGEEMRGLWLCGCRLWR